MTFFSPFPPFRPQAVAGRDGRPGAEVFEISMKQGSFTTRWAPTIVMNGMEITQKVGLKPQLSIYKVIYRGYNSIYNWSGPTCRNPVILSKDDWGSNELRSIVFLRR